MNFVQYIKRHLDEHLNRSNGYSVIGIHNAAERWQELFTNHVNSMPSLNLDQRSPSYSSGYGESYPYEETDEFIEEWINDIDDPDRNAMIDDATISC